MGHRHRHLSTLPPSAITALAALLKLPPHLRHPITGQPSPHWLAAQHASLQRPAQPPPTASAAPAPAPPPPPPPPPTPAPPAALSPAPAVPGALRASASLLARLDRALHPALLAALCPTHAALNPWLVRAVFLLVSAEATRRVRPLRAYLARPGRYAALDYRLGAGSVGEVAALVARLEGVAGLWTTPGGWERLYPGRGEGREGGRGSVKVRIESECEACIVAAVGGDEGVVADLWAVLRGRTHSRKKGRRPVLTGLVEAWVSALGDEKRAESERLGRVVKRVRRAAWRWRHGREGGKRAPRSDEGRERAPSSRATSSRSGGCASRDSGYGSGAASVDEGSLRGYRERERWLSDVEGRVDGTFGLSSRMSSVSETAAHPSLSSSSARHRQRGHSVHPRPANDHSISSRQYEHPHTTSHFTTTINTITHKHRDTVDAILTAYQSDVDYEDSSSDEDLSPQRLHHRASGWYDKRTAAGKVLHPAFRGLRGAAVTAAIRHGVEERSPVVQSATVSPLELRRERLGRYINEPQDEQEGHGQHEAEVEEYDSSKWTDVSIRTTTAANDDGIESPTIPGALLAVYGYLGGAAPTEVSSSSVYSTDGPGVPHPPGSRTGSDGSLPGTLRAPTVVHRPVSVVTALDDPFATPRRGRCRHSSSSLSASTAKNSSGASKNIVGIESSSRRSCTTPTAAAPSPSTRETSSISLVDFQRALDRLNLEGSGSGEDRAVGVPPGPVLPDHSVSVAGGKRASSRRLRGTRSPPRVHVVSSWGGGGVEELEMENMKERIMRSRIRDIEEAEQRRAERLSR